MKLFVSFAAGFLLGAALIFTSLKYHVVRASDGLHLVPKLSANFAETYVDIRKFSFTDWNQHRPLAVALAQNGNSDLLKGSASENLQQSINSVLEGLSSKQ